MKKLSSIIIACAIPVVGLLQLCTLDGFIGTTLRLLTSERVLYSDHYSDWRFKRIIMGDTKQVVTEILGTPLAVYYPKGKPGVEVLEFSQSGIDSWYPLRTITVSNGLVTKKTHFFYTD